MTLNIDLVGASYGQLTVTERVGVVNGRVFWRLQCACGNLVERDTGSLRRKRRPPQSCGCRRLIGNLGKRWKHGQSKRAHQPASRLYMVWSGMKARCEDQNNTSYPHYGARGITVCRAWSESFEAFARDMGERPAGTTLDRIDNGQGYFVGNCRWADPVTQNTNRCGVTVVNGMSLKSYAKAEGVPYSSLYRAVKHGEEPTQAATRLKGCARMGARGPRISAEGRASLQT